MIKKHSWGIVAAVLIIAAVVYEWWTRRKSASAGVSGQADSLISSDSTATSGEDQYD